MKNTFLYLSFFLVSSAAFAETPWLENGAFNCSFGMGGATLATVGMRVAENFEPIPPAAINFSGIKKELSIVKEQPRSAKEWARLYLSKEDAPNSLIVVLLNETSETERNAILINPNFKFPDRMNGSCVWQTF